MSPMAFLRKMRAERMARLLASTDLSVAEAGRSVGCKDPNYPSATFVGTTDPALTVRYAPPY